MAWVRAGHCPPLLLTSYSPTLLAAGREAMLSETYITKIVLIK